MDASRAVAYAVVAVLVAVPVLSGPLVAAVDLSVDRPEAGYTPDENLGDGRVNLTIVRMPERLRLVQGDYGDANYNLRIEPAAVQLHSVRGHPILTYKIRVPGLDLIRIHPHFLGPNDAGRLQLTIDSEQYAPEQITEREYTARLKILKRENGTMTMLRNVTAPVEVVE
jgi:hypothetical protein